MKLINFLPTFTMNALIINVSILVLAVTNVWIIIFHFLLDQFSFLYSPIISELFYREAAVYPEPFKIPLYVLLSFTFSFFIILFRKTLLRLIKSDHLNIYLKLTLFICLAVIFIGRLGSFPLANVLPDSLSFKENITYNLFIFVYVLLITVIVIEAIFIEKLFQKKSWFKLLLYTLILVLIAFFIFEPGFPILAYEYSFFLGPIWDVIKGKTIFTNMNSDYGFFAILFFSALNKLGLFQLSQLSIYVWFMFVIQYFIVFYLVYKSGRSLPLALMALFTAITINYFCYPLSPIAVTQYSAMRRLTSIFLLFILSRSKNIISRRFLIAPAAFSFWIIDTGIEIYLALGATLFLLWLGKYLNFKKLIASVLIMTGSLIGVFLLLNLVHFAFRYQLINYLQMFASVRQYGSLGLTFIPLSGNDFFWIFILIFFSSIIAVFMRGKYEIIDQMILLSANLTLFNSFYFVGRSHPANLLDLSILAILNLFLLLGLFLTSVKLNSSSKIIFYSSIFIIFIIYPAYQRKYSFAEQTLLKINKVKSGLILPAETQEKIESFFAPEKKLIAKNLTQPKALILSRDDTYLLIVSNKKNLLRVNPQAAVDTKTGMDFAIKDVVKVCPKKIAVDCTIYKRCSDFTSYTKQDFYTAPFILQEIENKCRVKYSPVECTNKLCIAISDNL